MLTDTTGVSSPLMQLNKTHGKVRTKSPELGQHTEEVLLEVGYTWDQIGKLKEDQVII